MAAVVAMVTTERYLNKVSIHLTVVVAAVVAALLAAEQWYVRPQHLQVGCSTMMTTGP